MQEVVLSRYFQGNFKQFPNYFKKTGNVIKSKRPGLSKKYDCNQESNEFAGFSNEDIISANRISTRHVDMLRNHDQIASEFETNFPLFSKQNIKALSNVSILKHTAHQKVTGRNKNQRNRVKLNKELTKLNSPQITTLEIHKYSGDSKETKGQVNKGGNFIQSNQKVNENINSYNKNANCKVGFQNNSCYTTDFTKHFFESDINCDQTIKTEKINNSDITNIKLKRETGVDIKRIGIDFEVEYLRLKQECYHNEIAEPKPVELKPSLWIPPRSPHHLIEEELYHDPWALLVGTIFLNKTALRVARPYVFWFLADNPSPMSVMDLYPKDLEQYFENLGLKRTRAVAIWRMTNDYIQKDWKKPSDLYGIGDYGDCAYRMFCLGDFEVEPKDRFLRIYKAWYLKIVNKGTLKCCNTR